MNRKILFLLVLVIPLLTMGAGCNSLPTTTPVTQPVTVPTVSTPDASLTPTTSPTVVAPTPPSDGTRALVAAETDATWVLYTNKALGYSVNTPTKGKYAPNWEMKYVDQNDSHISSSIEGGGCYFNHINPTPSNEFVGYTVSAPDGTNFCHTKSESVESGSNSVIDDFATAVGKHFIVIEFTKVITDASVFVASDYQKTLDGIMGTFQMNSIQDKVISWCDDKKTADNELWISSEYFNGMNHAPTVRHVCRGNKELIYLEMVWNDSATVHTGMLKSKNSETSLAISSKNKDPEFELIQNQDKNKVQFTIDKKIFMYDEGSDKFIENP